MAAVDAVECLKQGGEAWDNYVHNKKGMVDLKFADLVGCDLRQRELKGCDLTGAQLAAANLDRTIFADSILTGAQLTNASLVGSVWRSVTATRTNLSSAMVRGCQFFAVTFTDAQISGLTLTQSELHDCRLTHITFESSKFEDTLFDAVTTKDLRASGLSMDRCRFAERSSLVDWKMNECQLVDCVFNDADLSHVECTDGHLTECAMVHCNVQALTLDKTAVSHLDLSSSVVKGVDVTRLSPSTAILLNTSFVDCTWPPQEGSVTLTGRYIPSAYLLAQPIQDVYGLSPTLRRAIGDAQYLVRILADAKHPARRMLYRLWGATSAFGQSIYRLTLFSFLIVLVHTVAVFLVRTDVFNLHIESLFALAQAFADVGQAFLGFGTPVLDASNIAENAIMLSARIGGFLSLGLWISIASVQINRLSSM